MEKSEERMTLKTLSIIIPINGDFENLIRFLRAVSERKPVDFEIICIVNESEYSVFRSKISSLKLETKVVYSSDNPYIDGLRVAEGDYVFFVSSLDYISESFAETFCTQARQSSVNLFTIGKKDYSLYNKIFLRENLLKFAFDIPKIDPYNAIFFVCMHDLLGNGIEKDIGDLFGCQQSDNDSLAYSVDILGLFSELEHLGIYIWENKLSNSVKEEFYAIFFNELSTALLRESDIGKKREVGFLLDKCIFLNQDMIPEYCGYSTEERVYTVFGAIEASRFYKRRKKDFSKRSIKSVYKKGGDESPCLSVVIPFYNVEKYIQETMDCILNQSLADIEVICIDDGSTDNSLELVLKTAEGDSRVSVYSQENCGQAVARNRGIDLASGKYIYFMDSDDLLEPYTLEELFSRAEMENLDIIYFNAVAFGEQEECKNEVARFNKYYQRHGVYEKNTYSGIEMLEEMARYDDIRVSPCFQLSRLDFLRNINFRFHPGIIHEDNSFLFITMLQANKVGYCEHYMYRRRVRKASTMTTSVSIENVYGLFSCFLDVQSLLQTYVVPEKYDLLIYSLVSKYMLLGAYYRYRRLKPWQKLVLDGMDISERLLFDELVVRHSNV